MKINKKSILGLATFIICVAVFFACSKESIDSSNTTQSTLRTPFLQAKSYSKIKSDFNTLSKKEKTALWNEKLEQLLSLDLPLEHQKLIEDLKIQINKDLMDLQEISNISIKLATLTPEEDFNKMFTSLDNYKYNGKFEGKFKVSTQVVESFKVKNTETSKVPCNCEWTCSWYGSSSSNCSGTSSGCGFMWFFECEHAV